MTAAGSPSQRTMCSTGPKISCCMSAIAFTSKACGAIRFATELVAACALFSGARSTFASFFRRSMWPLMPSKASRSMTGPTSVASRAGLPATSSLAAPWIISTTWSAMVACTHSRRRAEQRWPALRKADCITASLTCSGSAVLSTTMALMPPVSAISGTMAPSLAARVRLMILATWVEPVNTTPATPGAATRAAPTVSPGPCSNCTAAVGMPAACSSLMASSATPGVCSAGLASTVLPVLNAAATWPRKMASGKFQGLMQTQGPRAIRRSSLLSPVGPGMAMGAMMRRASTA